VISSAYCWQGGLPVQDDPFVRGRLYSSLKMQLGLEGRPAHIIREKLD
jgi:hypothetical protein